LASAAINAPATASRMSLKAPTERALPLLFDAARRIGAVLASHRRV